MQKFVLLIVMLFATSFAEDFVAVNSYDGRDVLSAISYANVLDLPIKYLPPNGDLELFSAKVGSNKNILLIQGANPISGLVETDLKSKNNSIEIYTSKDARLTNLELAKRSGAKSFIVVDSAYADSAISVMPYADLTNSYVILASNDNAEFIPDAIKGATKVIIYGLVDESVQNALAPFNPETIGKGEDKFEDNLLIVEKTLNEFKGTRVVFVDGSLIEESMITAKSPIVLIGKLIPDQTYNFIKTNTKNDRIKSSLLVNQQDVAAVYDMKKQIESELQKEGLNKTFSVVVKFAQVIPSESSSVLVLDVFFLPTYTPNLEIGDVFYDGKNILVSLDNIGEGPAFYNYEVKVLVDGIDLQTFSSSDTKLIERGEQIPLSFAFNKDSVSSGNISYFVTVKLGSSKKSLEKFITKEGPLATIQYDDLSSVLVQSARYNKEDGTLDVTIKNNGTVDAFAYSKVKIILEGNPSTISGSDTKTIQVGSLIVEKFPLELSEDDIKSNENITVEIDYGSRVGFLIKKTAFQVDLDKPIPTSFCASSFIILSALLLVLRRI